jgi:hypothetical protein
MNSLAEERARQSDDEILTFDKKSFLSILSLIPTGIVVPEAPAPLPVRMESQNLELRVRKGEPFVSTWQAAKVLYRMRRERDGIIGSKIFFDPAWDILLDLYAAEGEGQRICISSSCIAASVPYSTALRCLRDLEAQALISRVRDRKDGRRTYVELTDRSRSALVKILDELRCQIVAV